MARILWTRVDLQVAESAQELARAQGITISEYIRQLIIKDLDGRSVFNAKLAVMHGNCDRGPQSNTGTAGEGKMTR